MSEIEITGVFENVLGMIYSAKQKAEYQVNSTIIICDIAEEEVKNSQQD